MRSTFWLPFFVSLGMEWQWGRSGLPEWRGREEGNRWGKEGKQLDEDSGVGNRWEKAKIWNMEIWQWPMNELEMSEK